MSSLSALRDKSSKGARISASRKYPTYSVNDLPGPGQYNPKHVKSALSYSLGGKLEFPNKNDNPGPGIYDVPTPSVVRHKNPSFDFSKSPTRMQQTKSSIDLGPGSYNAHLIND
jgi:hypothetical protein